MSRLILRFYSHLIRLAGGRPEVVLPLFRALEKANEGQNEILRQQNTRKTFISGQTLRVLTLVLAGLGSTVLGVIMVIRPGQMHPPLGVMVLVVVHYMVVMGMVVAQAGPGLLAQDDAQITGWWPLTRREQLLARISVMLRPALEVTVALTAIPLIIYIFAGNPPVFGALLFGAGLLVQAVGVTFGVTTGLLLMVRWFGRTKAERIVGMVSSGPMHLLILIYLPTMLLERFLPWAEAHPWVVALVPPVWFGAWGDITAGARLLLLAGIGLIVSFLMVWAGIRLAVAGDSVFQIQNTQARPGRVNASALIAFLLRPLMRGNEGWAVRKLLEAHLREDWRFIGSIMMVPTMLLVFGFGLGDSPQSVSPEDVQHTALVSSNMLMMLMFMGAMLLSNVQYSSTPEALWIVALADLDTNRMMDAQRGMIHGLVFVPGGIIYALRALELGASGVVVLTDLAILAVQIDLMMLILMPWLDRMPFSTRYTQDHSARRVLMSFVLMGVALVFMGMDYAYARVELVRYIMWSVLPLLWALFRWRSRRVMKDRRLGMDAVTV